MGNKVQSKKKGSIMNESKSTTPTSEEPKDATMNQSSSTAELKQENPMKVLTKEEKGRALSEILNSLDLLIRDLIHLIVEYSTNYNDWETTAFISWPTKGASGGIINYQQKIYLCNWDSSMTVSIYNTNGELLKQDRESLQNPFSIDIDENKELVYVAGEGHVTILNLNLEFQTSWKPPQHFTRGVKVDNDELYLTVFSSPRVYVCNSYDGKILKIYGSTKVGSNPCEFDYPYGLTIDKENIYVCDCNNNRIQVLSRSDGHYVTHWGRGRRGILNLGLGEFNYPNVIYEHIDDEIFYVGDAYSLQLFRKDGVCIQKIGESTQGKGMNQFTYIYGTCIIDNYLYVSDGNCRIQVFKWKS